MHGVKALNSPILVLLTVCSVLFGQSCATDTRGPEPPPLVALDTLLAPRSYDAPRLSPDGEQLAWLGELDGVQNLFVAPVDDLDAFRALTRRTGRGLQVRDVSGNVLYRWSLDGRFLLFPQDQSGDENWNLWRIDVSTGEAVDLTGLSGMRVELLSLSPSDPGRALVSISEGLTGLPQLFLVDLETGEREPVLDNPGFLGFVADHALRPRVGLALNAEGGVDLFAREGAEWRPMFSVAAQDLPALQASGYQKITRFDAENRRLYFYDSRGRDTAALVEWDFEADRLDVLASSARVDLAGVLYHPVTHRPQAYATNWTRAEWHPLDPALEADLAFLAEASEGDLTLESRSHDDRRWVVRFTVAEEPEVYWLYERDEKALRELFTATPQLEGLTLASMHPVVIESRDGLDLVSYVTIPPWLDPDDDGRPSEPIPLILLVHGGPSDERAQYASAPFVQWLANRGYGVFYVNYRGSPGFGKQFVNAQRLEWGGRMHDDLIDQVEWAIAEGIADPDRVAIMGGSYGGYATLVGMTLTPEVFACGVDLVGPSDLTRFMPHWNVDTMAKVVGDPRTEEGLALLRSRSPFHQAHRARHPLLIGQGANDSRVPQEQSDIMVRRLQEAGAEVTYLLYPDEGHGLTRGENQRGFWAVTEVFFGQCLGGRFEPLADQLVGSSVTVSAGVEHIQGLADALERR